MNDATRDHGVQPVEALMERWGLTAHQLVENSEEQLNHKQVQRARRELLEPLALKDQQVIQVQLVQILL